MQISWTMQILLQDSIVNIIIVYITNVPGKCISLILADVSKRAISVKSWASVSSLCECNNKLLFKRSSVMVDHRNVLIQRRAKKLLSAVQVVTGMVRYSCRSLSISDNISLAIGTVTNISAQCLILWLLVQSGAEIFEEPLQDQTTSVTILPAYAHLYLDDTLN